MKTIFTTLVLSFICISFFAQLSNVAILPSANSDLHPGTEITVTGTYVTTNAELLTISVETRPSNVWGGTPLSTNKIEDTDLSSGTINHKITIPADSPLKVDGNYMQYVRINVQYVDGTTITNEKVTKWISVTGNPTNIGNLSITGMEVFPNPITKGEAINIKADSFESETEISIYNITGCLIFTKKVNIINDFVINDANLISGIYTVVVYDKTKKAIKKLLVK